MSLQVYNTFTRRKEPFEPQQPDLVKMYICGPTVYDSTHIGHAMSYLIFDVIRRYLEFKGYQVRHVQNFTDIDDKIIQRAARLGTSPEELADRYSREYLAAMAALNIKEADLYPRATAEVPTIIRLIEGLIEQGHAYVANGNVYFKVTTFDGYGRLSRRSLAEMRAGEGVETSELKSDPADFTLWKAAKPGEPSWPSPWGPGRPGWHIECSAMCYHHLGEQIDIHGGGTDLIFPHHENEIAQSEAFTGKQPFVRYWLHNGLLQLGEQKMSKSLGNLITVTEFLKQHEADALRLFVLSSHYRRPITYTDEAIVAAEKGLERLRSALRPAHGIPPGPPDAGGSTDAGVLTDEAARARQAFVAAMDDDFNTAQAVAVLFDLVTAINRARDEGVGGPGFEAAQATLRELAGVLGLHLDTPGLKADLAAAPFIELLIEIRSELRTVKQWALADKIRTRLGERGIVLEDGPAGTTWRMK
jgi:cysteinyl-tRNA synthetase